MSCTDCQDPKTLGAYIERATGYACNALVGIAALYDVAATLDGEDKALFLRRARQLRRIARTLSANVLVPDDKPKQEVTP